MSELSCPTTSEPEWGGSEISAECPPDDLPWPRSCLLCKSACCKGRAESCQKPASVSYYGSCAVIYRSLGVLTLVLVGDHGEWFCRVLCQKAKASGAAMGQTCPDLRGSSGPERPCEHALPGCVAETPRDEEHIPRRERTALFVSFLDS